MLYPEVLDVKRTNLTIKIMLLISVLASITCLIVDFSVGTKFHWSFLAISGIVYSWISTMYSISKNVNIASHVMIQIICVSTLMLIIDYVTGYGRWAVNWGVPIALMAANTIMFVLTIVSRKKYFKYALYQIIILVFSVTPIVLYLFRISNRLLPVILNTFIASVTFITTMLLCGKELKEEIIRVFHI